MQSHFQNREVVAIWDPAIDFEQTDMGEYIKTRDVSKLKFIAGAKPEVYVVRPITNDIGAFIDAAPNENEKYTRAFHACVVQVKNFTDEQGRQFESWQPDKVKNAGKSIETIADLFTKEERALFPRATAYEIGAVAWAHSFFPKKIAPTFQLLPTSLEILKAIPPSPAAQATNTAETGPSESKPQEA